MSVYQKLKRESVDPPTSHAFPAAAALHISVMKHLSPRGQDNHLAAVPGQRGKVRVRTSTGDVTWNQLEPELRLPKDPFHCRSYIPLSC